MHAILLAHRLLNLLPHNPNSPRFNPDHVRVVCRPVKVVAAHVHHSLPPAATKYSKAHPKWAYDNYDALVLIAKSFNHDASPRDVRSSLLTYHRGIGIVDLTIFRSPNAPVTLYRSIIETLWSDLQLNVEYKTELRKTASAGLTYLSRPLEELQMNHRAYLHVIARSPRVNKYEVSPEVFVLSEIGKLEPRGWG
ncbi:hypothetical protein FS749_001105 [Ceratobasidium sp. UAMH 11750]|nr:hypothetical protein FS749_001105 [Ceratobasidium sp. UAMH 11750]